MRVGAVESLLGEHAEALNAFRRALDVYRSLTATDPAALPDQEALAEALRQIGSQYLVLGDAAAARSYIGQAVETSERNARGKPVGEEPQSRLAVYYVDLGNAQKATGDLAAAERSFRQSIAIEERIVTAHPRVANRLRHLTRSQTALVDTLRVTGRLTEAQRVAQDIVRAYEAVVSAGGSSSTEQCELAQIIITLGALQSDSGREEEARGSYKRARGLLETIVAANPARHSVPDLAGGRMRQLDGTGWARPEKQQR